MNSPRLIGLTSLALLVAAPLAGGWIAGLHPAFTEFPPLTQYIRHAPFSPWICGTIGLLFLACFFVLTYPEKCGFKMRGPTQSGGEPPSAFSWPWWGILGVTLTILAWMCAWGRFEWLGAAKDHCFFPLWLGYILTMDAVVFRRNGRSRLSATPAAFWSLFPASAVVWWYYEYLNRFVQNWWYEGVASFSPLTYALFATLCFSTVLPAVFETADWLSSFGWLQTRFAEGPRLPTLGPRAGRVLQALGVMGLVLLALLPNPFFFMVWVAPWLLLLGALKRAGLRCFLDDLEQGDYRPLFSLGLAALFCGFFWEMWNFWSLPKWHYSVPYVNAFHLFEMPLVGYSGYLPFGPVCWCLWRTFQLAVRGSR